MTDLLNKKPPLIILTGPTAVGKTDISIDYAKAVGGEIISADSIQIYKYMDIGSAKILPDEMQGIKHYLVDELMPDDEFNIYRFKQMADNAIKQIYSRGKIPIITGGTGFYIQSVIKNIDFNIEDDSSKNDYRLFLEDLADKKGKSYIHDMLKNVDEESAGLIHPNNLKRVIRALEYYNETGHKISEHNKEQQQNESPYNYLYFVLNRDRDILYNRINKRVDIMFEHGLVNEVKKLLDMGYNRNLISMQGLGYKEVASYLAGEISLEESKEIIKRDTRRFAKRQLTWFRREENVIMMNYEDFDNDKNKLCEKLINITTDAGIYKQKK